METPQSPGGLVNGNNGVAIGDYVAPYDRLSRHARTASPNLDHIDPNQIVFIIPASHELRGFFVYSLVESDPATTTTTDQPYRLSVTLVSHVPPDLLDAHVLAALPPHLRCDGSNQVHVIVSTKSGTGLARACWEAAVEPLLCVAERADRSSRDRDPDPPADATEVSDGLDLDEQGVTTSTSTSTSTATRHARSWGYNVIVTDSAQSVRQFAKERWASAGNRATDGRSAKTETVILLSGDGGIVDLLNGAGSIPSDSRVLPTVAVLPLGTGNALFHSLHKATYGKGEKGPSPLVAGLRTLFRGVAAPLPVFRADFSPGSKIVTYVGPQQQAPEETVADELKRQEDSVDHLLGAIVASYGFHASIVWESDTPEYRRHGAKRFGMVAETLLGEAHAYRCAVDVTRVARSGSGSSAENKREQPQRWERIDRPESAYVLATLVSNLERSFTISPASRPLDGRLRLVHFGAVDGDRTMAVMHAAYDNGAHVGMTWEAPAGGNARDGVGYEEIEALRVTVQEDDARWRKVCVDGTIVEVPRGGSMTVQTADQSPFRILVDPEVVAA